MNPNPKIILIDASSLRISGCKLRFKLVVIDGYRAALNNNDTEFGSAFHACAKEVGLTGDLNKGLMAALIYWSGTKMVVKEKKQYLDASFLNKVCNEWFKSDIGPSKDDWEVLKDLKGNPLVEYRFFRPFFKSENYEVLLVGTMDKIVKHRTAPNLIAIGDYKTTSLWDTNAFFEQYKLDVQLHFYTLILKKDIARSQEGDPLYPFKGRDVHSFIDGIFLKGADKPVEYKRSPIMRVSQEKLNRYETMLEDQVKELVSNLEAGHEFMPTGIINGSCKTLFGPCSFFNFCNATDEQKTGVLKREFIQTKYDPSKFGELTQTI